MPATKVKEIKRHKKGTSQGGEFASKDIGGSYPTAIKAAIKASKGATAQRIRVYKLKKKLAGMGDGDADYAATKKQVTEQSAKFDKMNGEAKSLRAAAKKAGYSINSGGKVTKSPGGKGEVKPKNLKEALKKPKAAKKKAVKKSTPESNLVDLAIEGGNVAALWKNAKANGVGGDALNKAVGETLKNRNAIMDATPPKLKAAMKARLDTLEEAHALHNTMRADGFGEAYSRDFTGHVILQRESIDFPTAKLGMNKFLPHILESNGVEFAGYRNPTTPGGETTTSQFKKYLEAEVSPNAAGAIQDTLVDQGGSSWSIGSMAYKTFLSKNMDTGNSNVYWDYAKRPLTKGEYDYTLQEMGVSAGDFEGGMVAMHAYTYNALKNAKMPNRVQGSKPGTLIFMRNTSKYEFSNEIDAPSIYNTKKGDSFRKDSAKNYGRASDNAIFESHSAVRKVQFGSVIQFREAPIHRVLAHYALMGRVKTTPDGSPFYNDRENEVIVIPKGLKTVSVNIYGDFKSYHFTSARDTFADDEIW